MNRKIIVQNKAGKIVGDIDGDTYTKKGRKTQLFRKYNSYGVDSDILESLSEKNIRYIKVVDKENKRIAVAKLDDFYKYGIESNHEKYGKQMQLKLAYWNLE